MSSLDRFINPTHFISFYKRYRDSTINLFQVDPEIVTRYYGGLSKFEKFLDTVDIEVDSTITEEMKMILSKKWTSYRSSYKIIFILLYKVINSHCLVADITSQELVYLDVCVAPLHRIVDKSFDMNFQVGDDRFKAKSFHSYTILLKIFRAHFTLDTKTDHFRELHGQTISAVQLSRQNEIVEKYVESNAFFHVFGFFCPRISSIDKNFFKRNLSLFSIIPSQTELVYGLENIMKRQISNENHLEIELLNNLSSVSALFTSEVDLRFRTQIRKTLPLGNTSSLSETVAILDIEIKVNGKFCVPLEIKFQGIKESYQNFLKSRDNRNWISRRFVQLFSQTFHQAIVSQSKIFFISDLSYCLCFIVDYKHNLSETDALQNLRRIKCKVIPFDAEEENLSVAVFIVMIMITFQENLSVNTDIFQKFKQSIMITELEKERLSESQYNLLYRFFNVLERLDCECSSVQPSDLVTSAGSNFGGTMEDNDSNDDITMEDSTLLGTVTDDQSQGQIEKQTIEDVHNLKVIENKIFEEFKVEIPLQVFGKVVKKIDLKRIAINDIKPVKIISGESMNLNYSTVLECVDGSDNEPYIYKIYDPIRTRIEFGIEMEYLSFPDKIKKVFEMFEREVATYTYLMKKSFNKMPTLFEVGFMTNSNTSFKNKILAGEDFPLSGFYLKLSKVDGCPLTSAPRNLKTKLIDAVDELNCLKVSHGDLHLGNIIYNEESDTIILFDFNRSYLAYYRGLNNSENHTSDMAELQKRIEWDKRNLAVLIRLCKW